MQMDKIDDTWVAASSTYNYMMKDPLLDWLNYHHGRKHKSVTGTRKGNRKMDQFRSYMIQQGINFERKVVKMLKKKFGESRVIEIMGDRDARDPSKRVATLDAMKQGVPLIHSGVIANPENKTYGVADLLVRSDWLKFVVKELPITDEEAAIGAPVLSSKWHYRVIDIKFTSLLLRANFTHLLNAGSFPAYKAQLLIYNQALGLIQGYTPDQVYILGRKWQCTSKGEIYSVNRCFDRLGVIDYAAQDQDYISLTQNAIEWVRAVKDEAASTWNITEYPLDRWELYPNMCNHEDAPWRKIKQEISDSNQELTNLWMVGPKNRQKALDIGIYQWSDKKCTPDVLGITGEKTSKVLNAIININRDSDKLIAPKFIKNNIGCWKDPFPIEFFVDFETYHTVVKKIKNLPETTNDTLIFMIGVGYIDPDTQKWIYINFTVDRLTFEEENRICTEFITFIRNSAQKYNVEVPKCYHWGNAEYTIWDNVVERHSSLFSQLNGWMWDWVDMLTIFKEEPIVLNGCFSFGLKYVANIMKQHNMIQTTWTSSCTDGRTAMITAYQAHQNALTTHTTMQDSPLIHDLIIYNEVDVKVLHEILSYLRTHHIKHPPKRKRTLTASYSPPEKRTKTNSPDSITKTHNYNLRNHT